MRAVIIVVALSSTAHADTEPTEPYRSAMMLGDGFAALLTLGGGALAYHERNCTCEDFSGELVGFGAVAYISIGAFVHHDAGQGGRAVGSVLVRLALPIIAGELAHGLGADTGPSLLAAGGGMVGAMAIDWFALADQSYTPEPKLTVYASPTGGGLVAGVSGVLPP